MSFKKIVFAALAIGFAAIATAQPGGPASRVTRGNGFGCAPPNVWVLESGGAICKDLTAPPPAPPVPPPSPVIPVVPPGSPLVLQPITVSAEAGLYSAVAPIIKITGTATSITLDNLNPKGTQTGTCTISPGQTCNWGFSTGSFPDPYGLSAADVFASCALDYSIGTHGTFFSATLNLDNSISITAVSVANTWVGWGDSTNYFNYAVIPANYASTSFRLPLDSFNTTGSGTGGRCWPPSGGGGS